MKTVQKDLLILHFINDGVRTSFVSLLPFIAKDLGLTLTHVGFLGASQSIAGALLGLPAAFIASKIGGLHVMLYSLLFYSLAAGGIGFSPNATILIITFYLGALGFGMFHPIGFATVAKTSEKITIGRNMADFTAIGDIGRIAIPSLALLAAPHIGWRFVIGTLGILGVLSFLFLRRLLPSKDVYKIEKPKQNHSEWARDVLALIKTKALFLTGLTAVIDSFASSSLYVFLPFLLLAKGVPVTLLGILMGVFFFGSLFGKASLGRAVDRLGNVHVFMLSELLMAGVLLLIIATNNLLLISASAFLLGIFTKGTSPVVQTLFSEVAESHHYEKLFAVSEIMIATASTVSQVLMGILADRQGVPAVFMVASLFAVFAIIPLFLQQKNR